LSRGSSEQLGAIADSAIGHDLMNTLLPIVIGFDLPMSRNLGFAEALCERHGNDQARAISQARKWDAATDRERSSSRLSVKIKVRPVAMS
jgi:hypothetical protein